MEDSHPHAGSASSITAISFSPVEQLLMVPTPRITVPWIHLGSVRHERDHKTSELPRPVPSLAILQTEAQRCQMMETAGHLA